MLEARELRYFVAVAEELHFGRAAKRLAIAQPPLSRAIQRLERRLGVVLLHRGARAVSLTEAGQVLLTEARTALDAVDAASRRTRRTGTEQPGPLVLATKAGASSELVSMLLSAYTAKSGSDIEVVLCSPGEQARMLRDGRADAALFQRPYDATVGLDTEDLRTEQQVLALPRRHHLADRSSISMTEITAMIDLPSPRWPRPDGTYRDGPGPQIRDHTQLFQLIALGRTYALVPASVLRTSLHDDLATVPVTDAPTVTTVIAWPPHSRSRAVADLVRIASELVAQGPESPDPLA